VGRRAHALVGRAAELDQLLSAYEACALGAPQVILLGGEAGVGKSRLLREFRSRVRDGWVLIGGCVELGAGELPFAPFIAALRHLPEAAEWPAARDALGPTLNALVRLVPSLQDRPVLIPEQPTGEHGEGAPDLDRAQLFELTLGALDRLGRVAPVVLVLEDLHWADQSTLDLLGFLAANLRTERVTLVVSVRTDRMPRRHNLLTVLAELSRHGAGRIELERLGREELADLAAQMLGSPPAESMLDELARRSDGNPFFAEELLAAGAVHASAPVASLRDVVLARVQELDTDAQRILRAAAVVGRAADEQLLADVAGLSVDDATAALRVVVDEGLLVPDGDEELSEAGYRFRHALAQETVYRQLLPAERRGLHAAVATALTEALGFGTGSDGSSPAVSPPADAMAELTQHWYSAGDAVRALASTVVAGRTAISVLAYAEAWSILQRALELCEREPAALQAGGVDRLELLELASEAARWTGELSPAIELCRKVIAGVDAEAAPVRAGVLWERLGRYLWEAGDSDGSLAAYERAAQLMATEPPSAARARAIASQAGALMLMSRYRESCDRAREAVALARAVGAIAEESHALATLGVDLSMLEDMAGAEEALTRARVLAVEVESMEDICRAYTNLSSVLEVAGRLAESAQVAMEGLDVARARGLEVNGGGILVGNAAAALLKLGRWDEVEALVQEMLPRLSGLMEAFLTQVRAGLLLARGDLDGASGELSRLEELSRTVTEPQLIGPTYILEAELAIETCRFDRAMTLVEDGIASVDDSEDKQFVLRLCALGLRARADRVLGRELPDSVGSADCDAASGERLLALAREAGASLVESGAAVAEAAVDLLECEAEAARCGDAPDAERWKETAEGWERLQQPLRCAYARFRAAEAFAERRDRMAAAGELRSAFACAERLGARKLLADIAALAQRTRLDISAVPETAPASEAADRFHLTHREREVLGELVLGRSNRQIARVLSISEKTASVHVSNILGKLGARSRTEAAAIAHRLRLLADEGA
jgi:DNA-binding CsgD family transcriptional regulator/tetratricopeptide (TPR) repeat protein